MQRSSPNRRGSWNADEWRLVFPYRHLMGFHLATGARSFCTLFPTGILSAVWFWADRMSAGHSAGPRDLRVQGGNHEPLAEPRRLTLTTCKHRKQNHSLLPSALLGPVRIVTYGGGVIEMKSPSVKSIK
jgi:hypothetical protein